MENLLEQEWLKFQKSRLHNFEDDEALAFLQEVFMAGTACPCSLLSADAPFTVLAEEVIEYGREQLKEILCPVCVAEYLGKRIPTMNEVEFPR